jgi:hypothetical protein
MTSLLNLQDKLAEMLNVYGRTLETYISKFEWDTQKYNTGGFVRDISGEISQVRRTILEILTTATFHHRRRDEDENAGL